MKRLVVSSSCPSLLLRPPQPLPANLFAAATPVTLGADEVLFLEGDAGDGCYRVEDGLLKVKIVSRGGSERFLAWQGHGAIHWRAFDDLWTTALGISGGDPRYRAKHPQSCCI